MVRCTMCHHHDYLYRADIEEESDEETPSFLEAESDVETELLTDGGDEE